MSSRLRSLDSKISFFAFADIITAVSGVLIFVALLLATDLGQPTDSRSQTANSEIEQRLQQTLRQQMETDARNSWLQELLAAAETAPALEKLEADVSRLRSQLSEERKKQNAVADQLAASQSAIESRDRTLGLTDFKATIQRTLQEIESIARKEAKARSEMENLEQQVIRTQSKLLKLRQREGQIWLIPDKSATTKEPILVTVAGSGATVEHFDHPDERRQLDNANADSEFESYLGKAKTLDQYVVFLVRPSGIKLFQDLLKSTRDKGFDVGSDALEEDRQIHFSMPPSVDESTPPTGAAAASQNQSPPNAATSGSNGRTSQTNGAPVATPQTPSNPQPVKPSTPPPAKSWWQTFLEFVGLG